MAKERVYMYALVEGNKPRCGLTSNMSAEDVRQDVLHNYDRPRHIVVQELDDMMINAEGQIIGPVPVPINRKHKKHPGGNQGASKARRFADQVIHQFEKDLRNIER